MSFNIRIDKYILVISMQGITIQQQKWITIATCKNMDKSQEYNVEQKQEAAKYEKYRSIYKCKLNNNT